MESSDLVSGASEMGSLTAHSNEESQFVGSSSGVHFINTVRQAFSKNLSALSNASSPAGQGFPPPEDTLVGSESSPRDKHHAPESASPPVTSTGDAAGSSLGHWKYAPAVAAQLGDPPPLDTAKELMMAYFRVWHPLFPFLHGPTFLQAMELLYEDNAQPQHQANQAPPPPAAESHRNTCWTTILQCVFNLASLLRPDFDLPPNSQIHSPSSIYSLLGALSCRNDLSSLQALLAAQLYLVAKMSLRNASTVGGCILRSMLHAGLHRCPFRYKQLSSHDRQLRKRVFWCAYAVDRYLSQALGLPLGIQDSDIDVCAPGTSEVHVVGAASSQTESSSIKLNHLNEGPREAALANYVESGKLTGRALELFHKSIVVRSIRRSSVLYLTSDVHRWWNSLPRELQDHRPTPLTSTPAPTVPSFSSSTTVDNKPFNFIPFFTVLYYHLILLINRPFLSLTPTSPEFCSALQTCICAARGILTALRAQIGQRQGPGMFWPGFLSAAWMSGLVLAFACQLGEYVLGTGSLEINECLGFLDIMSRQWETARHCHTALSLLSTNIHQSAQQHPTSISQNESEQQKQPTSKKRKADVRLHPVEALASQEVTDHPQNTDTHAEAPPDPITSDPNLYFPGDFPTAPDVGTDMEMSNFDLNMVGLLQDAGELESLFDYELFGSQFPNF